MQRHHGRYTGIEPPENRQGRMVQGDLGAMAWTGDGAQGQEGPSRRAVKVPGALLALDFNAYKSA